MKILCSFLILSLCLVCSCKKSVDEVTDSVYSQDNSETAPSETESELTKAKYSNQQGFSVTGKDEVAVEGFTSPKRASRFFGNVDEGDPIAFVLDFSGSMAGVREDLLKAELRRSLRALDAKVSFSIIVFTGDGVFLTDKKKWMKASTKNIEGAIALLNNQYAGGGTEWESGLDLALSLKPHPEVIYFMTDGDTDSNVDDVVDSITKKNQSQFAPARINTTALVQTGLNNSLIQLAKKNGGSFTWVDAQGKATTATK